MVSPTPPAHPSQTAFKRWFPFFALGAIWRSRPETRRHAPIRWQHMESLELRQLMAGTPAQLAFIVQPSQVAALSAVSPSIQVAVEDSTGITVTTDNSTIVSLTLTQNPIGGGFTNTSTISMKVTGGVANFTNVAFTTAGLYSISASSGTLAIPTSNIFTVTQPASKLAFVQAPVNLSAGQLFPNAVSVAIQDATGNVVTTDRSNITLTVVSGPGGGTINGTTTVQAINGIATFNGISLPKAGAYTIQARDGSLTVVNSASFTVSPGAPSQLAFAQPPVSAAGSAVLTPSPVVNILDALGNIVTSDSSTVTLSILTGPPGGSIAGSATAVASNGVATFSNISFPTFGVYTLQASDGSLHTVNSNSFAITGPAAQLIFQVQPKQITVGHTSSNNITVLVADAGGNLVTNDTSSVTISVASGPLGGSINGTTTVSAVNGVATFTGLNFSVPGTYTLDISDGVLTNATSNSFIVNGLADHLIFAQQPGPSAAKSPIPGGVTVSIVDTDGNVVIDDFSPVTIAMNETTALLTGTTAVAAFNGIASFTNLIPSSAGTYTLVASASGVADAVSDPFSVSPPPSKLVITQGPVNVAATSTMPPIVVKVENPDGSVATTDTSKITLAIVSGPANATLSGTTAVNAVAGVATFSNLKFSTPGTYQLVAFDGSLATDTSVTFVVSGPPSKLVIIQQPLA
ncbi:MAG TPA: hypothetical protein VHM90_20890, partial [Phycisphaerae bacterium]|nr:hypothetical protein [Phycisphaerae bacterium]